MVWSHLTLGREAEQERRRGMRGRNESDGGGVEDGGGGRRRQKEIGERGADGKGKGKEMR